MAETKTNTGDSGDRKVSVQKKTVATAIFIIVFGFVIGVITFVTIIGPILALFVVAGGIFLLVRTLRSGRPPI